jgi:transcriptional regulator with XRE-family HTH domain
VADPCNIAFGRYLRILRERRSLSLDEVAALSRTFADSVAKSYLSRVENGHISLALPKLIPLSRIYEVPAEVVLEHLELDMELDKVGGPDTAGMDYAQLSQRGKAATDRGAVWDAYAYFRDSVLVALHSNLMGRLRDHTEQLLCGIMNVCGVALKLGRSQLALHELKHIQNANGLSPRLSPLVLERLAVAHLALNQLEKARHFSDSAIIEAEQSNQSEYLGYFFSSRARIALQSSDANSAIDLFQKAFDAFRKAGQESECPLTLSNLARSYFSAARYRSARRALISAERLASRLHHERTKAVVRILLGEIEEIENRPREATEHWRAAAEIARQLNDKILRFKAEYLLYRHAIATGNRLAARAIEKRLHRISPWLPQEVEELAAFRGTASVSSRPKRKRVVPARLQPFPSSNAQ